MFCYKWVLSRVCLLRIDPGICPPLSVNVYGVKSGGRTVCTLNLASCDAGKKLALVITIQYFLTSEFSLNRQKIKFVLSEL